MSNSYCVVGLLKTLSKKDLSLRTTAPQPPKRDNIFLIFISSKDYVPYKFISYKVWSTQYWPTR